MNEHEKNVNSLYIAICGHKKNIKKIISIFLSNADCAELTLTLHQLFQRL